MPLTDSEVNRITQWINAKGVRGACPACGQKQWGLGDIVSHPVSMRVGADMVSEHLPVLTMVCGHCGYVMSFSAKLMGLR